MGTENLQHIAASKAEMIQDDPSNAGTNGA